GPQLAQRGRPLPADSQPAHHRSGTEEKLAFVSARPAPGDVELQELTQEVDREADPGAVEDRLARPIEHAHELGAVDPGDDGPELIAGGRDVEAADFYKQHCSSGSFANMKKGLIRPASQPFPNAVGVQGSLGRPPAVVKPGSRGQT